MAIRFDSSTRTLWLSISDLVDMPTFPGSVRLTPVLRNRAAMGRTVHTTHQAAQQLTQPLYQPEVTLRHELCVDTYTVHIHGRLDGLYDEGPIRIVEEIKSLLIPPETFAEVSLDHYPAYERQLSLYLYLLSQTYDGPLRGHLVLVNLADAQRKTLVVEPDPAACETFITQQIRTILARCEARLARASHRTPTPLSFPFATLRPYQEAMMEHVRLALADQSCVLLSAPTGIGKTVATLYPALERALQDGLRIFFVTPKTTQQQLVVDTLQHIAARGAELTAVHLRAKEKSCINELYYCHESVCDFAKDYTVKLEQSGVIDTLVELPVIGPEDFVEAGRHHRVCPFELSLDTALEADVIIGDYNYVFDPVSYLRRFFQDTAYDDCILIIDEAHNLYARARDYYSPVLHQRRVRRLLEHCANEPAQLFRDFTTFFQALETLFPSLYEAALETPGVGATTLVTPPLELLVSLRQQLETLMMDYVIYRRRMGQTPSQDIVQDFYYAFQRFCDVLTLGGDEFASLYYHHPDDAHFKILCKDASRFLQERLQGFHSVVVMSATLTPFAFYQDVLGFPSDRTFAIEFPSPFPPDNRCIMTIPEVTTTYRERQRDAPKIARIIEDIITQRPGNYFAFFPSFEYLRLVRAYCQASAYELLEQREQMSDTERVRILQRLRHTVAAPLLVLAVQGGIFAEGVDYPGETVVGAIIVGPGLPRFDMEQELIRAYYDERYDNGFAYAYLYPGMNRVIQAAGRVIRSETDVGIIALLGKRFGYKNYMALFPAHWYTQSPRELLTQNYRHTLERFWAKHQQDA